MKKITSLLSIAAITLSFAIRAHAADASEETTVKGEILDLACYVDHGGAGEKHAKCAAKCISSGLPVGIKGEDGKVYVVIGDHKPLNAELSKLAGQTATLKGKVVSKDGVTLLANAEIVK
jgi:hypothetical protein